MNAPHLMKNKKKKYGNGQGHVNRLEIINFTKK